MVIGRIRSQSYENRIISHNYLGMAVYIPSKILIVILSTTKLQHLSCLFCYNQCIVGEGKIK